MHPKHFSGAGIEGPILDVLFIVRNFLDNRGRTQQVVCPTGAKSGTAAIAHMKFRM
jgi:hypothetical protein